MGEYLALRIKEDALDYVAVVTKYPQFKDEIDAILIKDGYEHKIVAISKEGE